MNSITETKSTVKKVRPNLWQTADDAVIGYGAQLAPTGLYFCFTCGVTDCQHTQTVDQAWLAGRDSAKSDSAIPAAWWTVTGIDAFSVSRQTGEVTVGIDRKLGGALRP